MLRNARRTIQVQGTFASLVMAYFSTPSLSLVWWGSFYIPIISLFLFHFNFIVPRAFIQLFL